MIGSICVIKEYVESVSEQKTKEIMMKLKRRYVVLKLCDIDSALGESSRASLSSITKTIANYREDKNKAELNGIFIEDDWPEYEVVLKMLSDRMEEDDAKEKN